jgi:hypothetical protein
MLPSLSNSISSNRTSVDDSDSGNGKWNGPTSQRKVIVRRVIPSSISSPLSPPSSSSSLPLPQLSSTGSTNVFPPLVGAASPSPPSASSSSIVGNSRRVLVARAIRPGQTVSLSADPVATVTMPASLSPAEELASTLPQTVAVAMAALANPSLSPLPSSSSSPSSRHQNRSLTTIAPPDLSVSQGDETKEEESKSGGVNESSARLDFTNMPSSSLINELARGRRKEQRQRQRALADLSFSEQIVATQEER